jgi:hypothetical protein
MLQEKIMKYPMKNNEKKREFNSLKQMIHMKMLKKREL